MLDDARVTLALTGAGVAAEAIGAENSEAASAPAATMPPMDSARVVAMWLPSVCGTRRMHEIVELCKLPRVLRSSVHLGAVVTVDEVNQRAER